MTISIQQLLKRYGNLTAVVHIDLRAAGSERIQQRIGLVPQEVALYDDLSAYENALRRYQETAGRTTGMSCILSCA